jgi:hypothetical protein
MSDADHSALEARITELESELAAVKRREDIVRRNLALFDRLDFEAWNKGDFDLFHELHTEDVKVVFGPWSTAGREAHFEAMRPMMETGSSRIVSHDIMFGQGEWTCSVATTIQTDAEGNAKEVPLCTVARWRDGSISEEYLFMSDTEAAS